MEFTTQVLDNGIRFIHKETPNSHVSHCGFVINAGTRDEEVGQEGIAHFIEHTLFKGTKNRKSFHILSRLDAVGGELNAYTTKEDTCIYASFLNADYKRAIELVSDITFNATFPSKEVTKEKEVVIDEINASLDTPGDEIFDDFEAEMYKNHPLGYNILGSIDSVKKMKRADVLNFYQKNYVTEEIVFAYVGNVKFKTVLKMLESTSKHIVAKSAPKQREPFKTYTPFNIEREKHGIQSHILLGTTAYDVNHVDKNVLILLNNYLGGPAMNSRLNLEIREKHGYTYHVESNYTAFADSGIFSIYLATEPKWRQKSIELVMKELKQLRNKPLGVRQLQGAKQQIIGQISLAQESGVSTMMAIGKSMLTFNKVESLDSIFNRLNEITAQDIQRVANDIFDEDQISSLIYNPK